MRLTTATALAIGAAGIVTTGVLALSGGVAPVADTLGSDGDAAASASPIPSLPPTPVPSLTPRPLPSVSPPTLPPLPSLTPTRSPSAVSPAPLRSTAAPATSACRYATKRTEQITLTLEVCPWPGPQNDSYTLTMKSSGDQVFRTVHVEHDDGTTEPYERLYQWGCAQDERPNPIYHGERIHEWGRGTFHITGIVKAHDCGRSAGQPVDDPDSEDTDVPHEARVTFVLTKP